MNIRALIAISNALDVSTDWLLRNDTQALQRDLANERQLNRTAQETIDYLIAENRELRDRCERYLKALAMIVE